MGDAPLPPAGRPCDVTDMPTEVIVSGSLAIIRVSMTVTDASSSTEVDYHDLGAIVTASRGNIIGDEGREEAFPSEGTRGWQLPC